MWDNYGKTLVVDFLKQLNQASTAVLMLDYDGTLAPFQTERDRAYPYPGIVPILDRIIQSGKTKVIVVSGRPVREVESLLHPLNDIDIWGAHGLEHLSADGTYQSTPIDSSISETLAQAKEWLRKSGLPDLDEIKPGGIAFHWRGLPAFEIKRLQTQIQAGWRLFAEKAGLKLLDFDGGIELRATHPDKGDAVAEILKRADASAPAAFLGDDLTDEDGFRVLDGRGLSVLVRSEYRRTQAKAWLRPPNELINFLEQWSRMLSK
jgi:trehalose 6-phosphate phosphatase